MRIAILRNPIFRNAALDDLDTLAQARAVAAALRKAGHEVATVSFSLDISLTAGTLAAYAPDAVFNLVESVGGSARLAHLAPAILEQMGIAFTGSGSQAMFLSTNKLTAKAMLARADLPTPAWRMGTEPENGLGRTWIIKSVWEHASFGLDDASIVHDARPGELSRALEQRRKQFGGEWFAEEFISGREFNVSLIAAPGGPRVLQPAEIIFTGFGSKPEMVGYRAKWDEDSAEFKGTVRTFSFPDSDSFLLENLCRQSAACWRLFGMSGYARIDFRVDRDGRPYIIDINANPCLNPDAGFAAALDHCGMDFDKAVLRIVEDTLGISGHTCGTKAA